MLLFFFKLIFESHWLIWKESKDIKSLNKSTDQYPMLNCFLDDLKWYIKWKILNKKIILTDYSPLLSSGLPAVYDTFYLQNLSVRGESKQICGLQKLNIV